MFSFNQKNFSSQILNFSTTHQKKLQTVFKALTILIIAFILLETSLRVAGNLNVKIRYFLYSSRYDLNLKNINNFADLRKNAPCPFNSSTNINDFVTNSKGFYTSEYQYQKPENTVRIGFIGDSFLIGVVPYPQNFVTLLKDKLQTQSKDKTPEIINWGLPCLGPGYEKKVFEIEGIKTRPDYVVWNLFVGNDFIDESYPGEKFPSSNLIAKNFYTIRLFRNLYKSLVGLQLRRETPAGKTYDDNSSTYTHSQYQKITAEKLYLFSSQTFPQLSWQNIQQTLLSFKKQCDEQKIKCLVVIIPDEIQVNEELLDEVINSEKLNRNNLILDYPQKQIDQFLQKNNFTYLDLLSVFQKAGKQTKLYKPDDSHWNIAGNHLAAEEIFSFISAK